MSLSTFHSLVEQDDPSKLRGFLAQYLDERRDLIRDAARAKLIPVAKSSGDSEDVASSVIRRIDSMAVSGTLRIGSENELWALIRLIAEHQSIDRGRMALRARAVALDDGVDGHAIVRSLAESPTEDHALLLLHRILMSMDSADDRHLVLLRLRGSSFRVAGQLIGISTAAAKMRWSRITSSIRDRFAEDLRDDAP